MFAGDADDDEALYDGEAASAVEIARSLFWRTSLCKRVLWGRLQTAQFHLKLQSRDTWFDVKHLKHKRFALTTSQRSFAVRFRNVSHSHKAWFAPQLTQDFVATMDCEENTFLAVDLGVCCLCFFEEGSAKLNFLASAPERFGLLKTKNNHSLLFVQVTCPTNYICGNGNQTSGSGSRQPELLEWEREIFGTNMRLRSPAFSVSKRKPSTKLKLSRYFSAKFSSGCEERKTF